jgi:hypothetical protein
MSTTQQDQTIDKPRQRGRKAGKRGAKAESAREGQPMDAVLSSADADSGTDAQAEQARPVEQSLMSEVEPVATEMAAEADVVPGEATAAPAESPRVNVQTIADACRDYTKKSIQENRRFVEQMMGVRTFDKAVAAQADYARQTYTDFVAQSQRIYGLYRELAKQSFKTRSN